MASKKKSPKEASKVTITESEKIRELRIFLDEVTYRKVCISAASAIPLVRPHVFVANYLRETLK